MTEVIVCDPRRNKLLEDGSKADKVDARKLAELLRAGLLKPKTSSRESIENDSANGTHTLCFPSCDGGHAASFSDEASILELCWLGGRHPYELGI